jgi:hypothetical protein
MASSSGSSRPVGSAASTASWTCSPHPSVSRAARDEVCRGRQGRFIQGDRSEGHLRRRFSVPRRTPQKTLKPPCGGPAPTHRSGWGDLERDVSFPPSKSQIAPDPGPVLSPPTPKFPLPAARMQGLGWPRMSDLTYLAVSPTRGKEGLGSDHRVSGKPEGARRPDPGRGSVDSAGRSRGVSAKPPVAGILEDLGITPDQLRELL